MGNTHTQGQRSCVVHGACKQSRGAGVCIPTCIYGQGRVTRPHPAMDNRKGSQRSTPLADLSITEAIARLSSGRISHERYFEDVLTRYEQCKFAGAFVGPVDADSFAAGAVSRDNRRRKFRHKLFGIPFIVKDSIDVAGIATSCWCVTYGSLGCVWCKRHLWESKKKNRLGVVCRLVSCTACRRRFELRRRGSGLCLIVWWCYWWTGWCRQHTRTAEAHRGSVGASRTDAV